MPDGYKPEHVAPALTAKIQTLPEALRRALTWDQGPRCATGSRSASTPASRSSSAIPTRRGSAGSNENTNGLLRQYFPAGTDFSTVTEAHLDAVADELNDRPRKRLGFAKPREEISDLLLH